MEWYNGSIYYAPLSRQTKIWVNCVLIDVETGEYEICT